MKKVISLLIIVVMLIGMLPVVSFAATATVSATKAFCWNFNTNAQHGNLPTVVSWGDRRATFMSFEIPDEILEAKADNVKITGILTADMTFNNGRVVNGAPIVTIISADADSIDSVNMSGGASASTTLTNAWKNGTVLTSFDTLNEDESPSFDLTDIIQSGKTSVGLYLTCRSEDGYFETGGIVNFNSPQLKIVAGEITGDFALEEIDLPYNLEDGYELPEEIYGKKITWSEEIKAQDATVYKTITASIEGKTKDFEVMIMGKEDNFVAAYTEGGAGGSMHLALKTESGWQELNFGFGVLYAHADLDDGTVAGTTRTLRQPYLYRKDSGKIGVAAYRYTVGGQELTLWETDNLVDYNLLGVADSVDGYESTDRVKASGVNGSISCILPITNEEADYLSKKLGEVKNTTVEPVNVRTAVGEKIEEMPDLTANYTDGSTAEIPVIWDEGELDRIDFNKAGIYTVTGEAVVKDYPSPMIYGRADPVVYIYNGKYYFIATDETGNQADIYLRSADTIEDLADSEEVCIFKHTESGDLSGCNWAPELHEINGELYCLFASTTEGGSRAWRYVQCRIMKCTGDPMNPDSWEAPVRVTKSDGSPLIGEGITLDMTYFEVNGTSYYCWAERPITSAGNGNSQIVIATVDPKEPSRLTSEPVLISIPSYTWDRSVVTVNEGPAVLKRNGKLYMTFSGNNVDNSYCVGLLTADENADLLNPMSWKKTGYPILASAHVSGEYGPGHNVFTVDEYGQDVIILHMRPNGGTRSMTARTVHYGFDGTPILYMTADRMLKEEYRTVTATIVVANEDTSENELLLNGDANALTIENADAITNNLTLAKAGALSGAKITWKSSDTSVITNDGVVIRGVENRTVTMTATLTLGELTATKVFEVTVLASEDKVYTLNIDASKKSVDISEDMYGIFFEDVNYAADGGIYSEVVENRSFEAAHCNPDRGESYTKIPDSGWTVENAVAEYLSENPLNENNTTYLHLSSDADGSILNECYSGFAVHEGESFNASIFARGSYDGKITVSIVDGDDVLGSVEFSDIGAEFEKHTGIIETVGTADSATVKVTFDTEGTIDMDMISVQSRDTYNSRENGLRKDIVQALADLNPAFIRFPGGCLAEGYYLENRYSWKDSIGPVEKRRENWNRWQTGSNAYDYCQTLGLGFYEYFLLCEDIGAKPLPVINVGIACQYQSGEYSSWEDLYDIYIQDAIDLIEFANGDPETNEWAAIRAEMGHPEPFNLEYIGIGNEQWNTAENRFFERYEAFEKEIHALYPDIKLISTSGPSANGTNFENAWNWLETHNGEENFAYAVDEHYYKSPQWFLSNVNRYDSYNKDGFGVYVGEYAATGSYGNTLYSALAEAAYMTGLEENADIVKMTSYAPLLAKIGYNQWSPNMIWFNNSTLYKTPDYYVQSMYSDNKGSYTLVNEMAIEGGKNLSAGIGTWNTAAQFKDIKVTDNETDEVTVLSISGSSMSITASYEPEANHPATNLIDGNTDKESRWAADRNGAYATLDLGKTTYVSKVAVSFLAEAGRKYHYKIEISTDGEEYTNVFDGESGINDPNAHYTEVNALARYIRLISNGRTINGGYQKDGFFSPTELTVFDEDGAMIEKIPGEWSESDGVITQSNTSIAGALNVAKLPAKNYTLELKAMKTAGSEGFLIPFNYQDAENYIFWNLGGWNNTQSAIQQVSKGAKMTVSDSVSMTIEDDVWYDIKIVADKEYAYCYLNGELVHTQCINPVYSTVSYDEENGDIIVKLVNAGEDAVNINIDIANAEYIAPKASAYVLTGDSLNAANSIDNPTNVLVEEDVFEGASDNFVYALDGYSFVVLRLHTTENYTNIYFKDNNKAVFNFNGKAKAIVAIYDEDGSLIETKSKEFIGTKRIGFTVPENGKVKAFMWDDNMLPLAHAEELIWRE